MFNLRCIELLSRCFQSPCDNMVKPHYDRAGLLQLEDVVRLFVVGIVSMDIIFYCWFLLLIYLLNLWLCSSRNSRFDFEHICIYSPCDVAVVSIRSVHICMLHAEWIWSWPQDVICAQIYFLFIMGTMIVIIIIIADLRTNPASK